MDFTKNENEMNLMILLNYSSQYSDCQLPTYCEWTIIIGLFQLKMRKYNRNKCWEELLILKIFYLIVFIWSFSIANYLYYGLQWWTWFFAS